MSEKSFNLAKIGLVSVSFRQLSCESVIAAAAGAGLHGIEWGGDIHVKPGELERAREVAALTRENGLSVTSYGSYYRLGTYGTAYAPLIDNVFQTADVLGAPAVRIWGYNKGSAAIDADTYRALVAEAKDVGKRARALGVKVAFECHGDTITDEYHAAQKFLCDVDCPEIMTYWQPNNQYDVAYNKEAANALRSKLVNVHVFNWPTPGARDTLFSAVELWREYAEILTADGADPWWLLEFMPDDKPESLPKEADALRAFLSR